MNPSMTDLLPRHSLSGRRVSRTPLALRVAVGSEDQRLLEILSELDRYDVHGGLSQGERDLKQLVWDRLDWITNPRVGGIDGEA